MRAWLKARAVTVADLLVYASTAYTSVKSQLNDASVDLIDLGRAPTTDADAALLEAAGLLRPWQAPGLTLTRIGGDGDGGYVMAELPAPSGAISIGIGPDVSWDRAMSDRGVPIACFDPTVRGLPSPVPNGRFFRVGIGANPPEYRPLDELVGLAGFTGRSDLVLKIDVEGAEWPSLASVTPEQLSAYTQIAIEMHDLRGLMDPRERGRILGVLNTLAAGHRPVHVHANNYDAVVRFGSLWFANAIEVTYVRADCFSDWAPRESLAVELDRPNDPRVSEISLAGMLRAPMRG